AWRSALLSEKTPTVLALTRQNLPVLGSNSDAEKGGYILDREEGAPEPQVILMASGSEVSLCLDAKKLLEADGIATRVVSMPCMEVFANQDEAYRNAVLPDGDALRVAVEAGSSQPWGNWIGTHGISITMDCFGASAPAPELFRKFGFTPENIARRARQTQKRNL
ncbi:MAG: transketolase, partial [Clostridiales Family XIII bacterium]|nr:transketolase [Clostridiales Family XIII bacterium]